MKAVILAAGVGRRMRPLTDTRHKTLLPIAGTTILQRLLQSLRECDVRDVCVVTGYRRDDVVDAVRRECPDLNTEFVHNPRYETTNNVYSMALALERASIDDDILLVESDLIVDPRVMQQIVHSNHPNAALVDRYRPGLDGTVVSVAPDDAIVQVFPPHLQDSAFDFSDKYKTLNIYRFDKAFARDTFGQLLSFYSRSIDDGCYYELLLGVLIYLRAATVFAEHVKYPWAEVDDPNDLQSAEFEFDAGARRSMVERSWGGHWSMPHLDFAFIRNSYFPTPAVIAELRQHLGTLVTLYGSSQEVLNRKLAYVEGCDESDVFLLNGASQAFPILRQLVGHRRALVPEPTFGEYARVFPEAETYRDRGQVDLDAVRRQAASADVVVVVNPNNPTGTVVPSSWVADLARERPERLVIVDESFIDFCEEASLLPALREGDLDNVIVLKSLSKSLGVPGIRIGYVATRNAEVFQALRAEIPVWNVNSLAENFLEVILKHRSSLTRSYERVKEDRAGFASSLEHVPGVQKVFPSGGNFLLVRLVADPESTDRMVDVLMEQHRVHVKDVSSRFDDGHGYLRLAVREPDENDRLCELLRQSAPVRGPTTTGHRPFAPTIPLARRRTFEGSFAAASYR